MRYFIVFFDSLHNRGWIPFTRNHDYLSLFEARNIIVDRFNDDSVHITNVIELSESDYNAAQHKKIK